MRELLKIREVAGSTVVTLPQSILDPIGLRPGDRVLVEATPPRRITLTKEGATMQSTARLELEIDVLEKRRQALESDLAYKGRQHETSMPCDEGMSDPDVALLLMSRLARDRDRLDFEIAQKKIELYDLLGVPSNDEDVPVSPPPPVEEVGRRVVTGGDGTNAAIETRNPTFIRQTTALMRLVADDLLNENPGRQPTPGRKPPLPVTLGGRSGRPPGSLRRRRTLIVLPHLDTPPARTFSQSSVQENPGAM